MDGLQLRSLVTKDGMLELSLARVAVPEPAADEVVVRIAATPINPRDIFFLFGTADMRTAKASGTRENPIVTATIPQAAMRVMAARVDESLPVGNEGAGEVIKAGSGAQHLLGKTVAIIGGAMYAQYRCLRAANCLVLQPGTSAAEGASFFVNPLTALGMVETMRREGHTALVHTAAASNLGQMLMKFPLETSQMRTKASEQLSPECWIPPGNAVASTSCATCSLIPVGRHGASSPPSSTVPTCRLFHPPSRR